MVTDKKNGVIMTINEQSGLVILVATVLEVTSAEVNGNKRVTVKVQYDGERDRCQTLIYFWNDSSAENVWQQTTADRIEGLHLRKGSIVMIRCKFRDKSQKEATGYRMYYNGLIKIRPDSEHDKDDRSVLFGTVTSLKDVTVQSKNGMQVNAGVRVNVYAGKWRPGKDLIYHYVNVTLLGDLAIMAKTDLAPVTHEDGTETRKNVAFRCGSVSDYYHDIDCPICGEAMKYNRESKKMICPMCGSTEEPVPERKSESVFGYDYMVTGERTSMVRK